MGFAFTAFLVFYAFPYIEWLKPYRTYQHPALVAWMFCMIVVFVASLLTKPPPTESVEGIIWSPEYARLPAELRERYSGIKDYRVWWLGFVLIILAIYGYFLWWRFEYPASETSVW